MVVALRDSSRASGLPNPPIFVVGHARSGTTWLFDILTTHPEVAGVFESWMFTKSNGFVPLLKAHWGHGLLATKESVIGRHPGLGQMINREEAFEAVRSLSLDWLGRVLEDGRRFVVEKGPMEYDVVDELFPDARFVHIMRDGRDVAVSMRDASRTWAPEMLPHIGRSLTGSAPLWRDELRKIELLQAKVGERFFELRYEDLRADPPAVAARAFEFCGIPCSSEQLEGILASSSFESKKASDRSGFVRKGQVGDWRSRFGSLDALRFQRSAGDMLIAKGYVHTRWWWLAHARERLMALATRRDNAAT